MTINAQDERPQTVDEYIATGRTIIIAKVLEVAPVMRSGTIMIRVQVLHVLKGKEKLREITVSTNFMSMVEGATYLLRSENEQKKDENYFRVKSIDSMIQLYRYEDIEELKKMPLKNAVLTIMYARRRNLDFQIKQLSNELKRLEQITKDP